MNENGQSVERTGGQAFLSTCEHGQRGVSLLPVSLGARLLEMVLASDLPPPPIVDPDRRRRSTMHNACNSYGTAYPWAHVHGAPYLVLCWGV